MKGDSELIAQVMRRAEATYSMMRALEICASENEAYQLTMRALALWLASKQNGKTLDESIAELKEAERQVLADVQNGS